MKNLCRSEYNDKRRTTQSCQRVCEDLAGARKSETACVAELMKMYQKLVEKK